MPTVTVSLPVALTSPEAAMTIECEAATVAEALQAAVAQRPQFAKRVFFKDRLLVSIVLNGRHLAPSEALGTALVAGDRVEPMPPVAGG